MNQNVIITVLGIVIFALFVFISASIEFRLDSIANTMFDRINDVNKDATDHYKETNDRLIKLEKTIDEHNRLRELEKWSRDVCLGNMDEACGRLGPIKK